MNSAKLALEKLDSCPYIMYLFNDRLMFLMWRYQIFLLAHPDIYTCSYPYPYYYRMFLLSFYFPIYFSNVRFSCIMETPGSLRPAAHYFSVSPLYFSVSFIVLRKYFKAAKRHRERKQYLAWIKEWKKGYYTIATNDCLFH